MHETCTKGVRGDKALNLGLFDCKVTVLYLRMSHIYNIFSQSYSSSPYLHDRIAGRSGAGTPQVPCPVAGVVQNLAN